MKTRASETRAIARFSLICESGARVERDSTREKMSNWISDWSFSEVLLGLKLTNISDRSCAQRTADLQRERR